VTGTVADRNLDRNLDWNFMGTLLLITIFLPLAFGAVIWLAGTSWPGAARWLALAGTVLTLVLALGLVASCQPRPEFGPTAAGLASRGPIQPYPEYELKADWLSFGDGRGKVQFYLGLDGISLWLVALTALLMVPSVLVSWEAITDRPADFYALLLLLETGMLGVFCAFDLVLFYVFFEFTLIPLFFLIGIWGGPQKRYAARKFFVYTLTGSLMALVGLVGLVLAVAGLEGGSLTFSLPELARSVAQGVKPSATVQWWLFLALFAGFAVKVPLVPFHTWLPLAHVEAPTAGSVLLAGVLLKLGTYGFLRLCLPLLPDAAVAWVPAIAVLAVIGILYGAVCALAQDDIKKLVAYSSVSHLGFCMLGLFALNAEGVSGSLLQMVNHGLSTGLLFLIVGMIYDRYHTRQLTELGGLASRLPLLACFMVFSALSSLALPGLNGFVGETLCLIGMFKAQPVYAVVGALGIILGAWYLLAMLRRAFFGPLKEPKEPHGDPAAHGPPGDLTAREVAALAPVAAVCLLIGVYPQPFLDAMRPDVNSVVGVVQKAATAQPDAVARGK
jgi:NADH-quinone oxidoreductase subunit M